MERDGSLFSANPSDPDRGSDRPAGCGVLLRRGSDAADAEEIAKKRAEKEAADAALPQILELPKEEAEIVTPKISKKKILLESHSVGLPKGGIWRENFALADIDGDGRPEIISPPPRLSGEGLRIFKWDGERWRSVTPQLENPDSLHIGYGAIATGDLDGDGRTDIVWGGHGGGVWAGRNLGDMKFRLSRNGLSGEISTRALAVGDLDGDGKPDVLVLSDMPEAAVVDKPRARPSGYIEGYDVRAYINKGDRFVELVAGLDDKPCYGYSIGLETRPADKGAPFFATSCNYYDGREPPLRVRPQRDVLQECERRGRRTLLGRHGGRRRDVPRAPGGLHLLLQEQAGGACRTRPGTGSPSTTATGESGSATAS